MLAEGGNKVVVGGIARGVWDDADEFFAQEGFKGLEVVGSFGGSEVLWAEGGGSGLEGAKDRGLVIGNGADEALMGRH